MSVLGELVREPSLVAPATNEEERIVTLRSEFHHAIAKGDIDAVRNLLAKHRKLGLPPPHREIWKDPETEQGFLHVAIQFWRLDIMRLLVKEHWTLSKVMTKVKIRNKEGEMWPMNMIAVHKPIGK